MSFKSITFWCESPEKVKWKEFKELIDFRCSVYVISRNKKEFENCNKKIKNKFIDVGAWPALSFEEGYWFSGLTSKKSIDKLKEFKGLNIKIDLEPPIRMKVYSDLQALAYAVEFFLFRNYPNNNYLMQTINELSKDTNIIASGYPFPKFLSKKYGGDIKVNSNIRKNYFIYTSMLPFKSLFYKYYKWFIKNKIKEEIDKCMFALGCIGPGIYGNERIYKNLDEFNKDLKMFNNLNVKNIVVFEVCGLMNRSNPKEWIEAIKGYLK